MPQAKASNHPGTLINDLPEPNQIGTAERKNTKDWSGFRRGLYIQYEV